jgi:hypothetical protein
MSRYLDNLERLSGKWSGRLGPQDALVLQLKDELESLRSHHKLEQRRHDWSVGYTTFIRHAHKQVVQQ